MAGCVASLLIARLFSGKVYVKRGESPTDPKESQQHSRAILPKRYLGAGHLRPGHMDLANPESQPACNRDGLDIKKVSVFSTHLRQQLTQAKVHQLKATLGIPNGKVEKPMYDAYEDTTCTASKTRAAYLPPQPRAHHHVVTRLRRGQQPRQVGDRCRSIGIRQQNEISFCRAQSCLDCRSFAKVLFMAYQHQFGPGRKSGLKMIVQGVIPSVVNHKDLISLCVIEIQPRTSARQKLRQPSRFVVSRNDNGKIQVTLQRKSCYFVLVAFPDSPRFFS